ncbi:hypothetical protein QTP88_011396 [Uroleucon formosanum]
MNTRDDFVNSPTPNLPTSTTNIESNPSDLIIQHEPIAEASKLPEPEGKSATHSGFVSSDPAEWIIKDTTIEILLARDINQNLDCDFTKTRIFYEPGKFRSLNKNNFKRKLKNGEEYDRKYLIYSPSKKSLFCMPCRLFGGKSSLAKEDGCNDWKNINQILSSHENSKDHHICQKAMLDRSRGNARVDNTLCSQIDTEIQYWKNVLKRVLAVIKKLSSRGLAFRGHDERFGSSHNGNYMMCLELLADFDPFLANHITTRGNPGKGNTSYLSSTICDEFINLMAKHVTNKIVNEIKQCKYFSIVVHSTPDISHIDQLSFVLRYVKDGTPVERFLRFLPKVGHKSENMEDTVLSFLENLGIDINNCRGQSYDNASNMSGAYTGLQARIVKHNSLAMYVPCSAHSLNLVGSCAAECVPEASEFFNTIQTIFTFFAASTNRWNIFTSSLKNGQTVLKRANGTRWSSKHDACKSLATCWTEVIQSLSKIRDDMMEKPATWSESKGYIDQINNFEFVFMTIFWNTLLERFNATSKSLQSIKIHLETVVHLYRSLTDFVIQLRNEVMFEEFINKARQSISEEYKIDMKRAKTRSLLPGETRKNETKPQNGKDNLRINVYYPILDCIQIELKKRQLAYTEVAERFDFLQHLNNFEADIILKKAEHLQMLYKDDLDDNFLTEVLHFKEYEISNFEQFIEQKLEQTFPNIFIALRMFLSMAVSNCTAERSFSALKRIKMYLRANLLEEKLNALSILCIENRITNELDFDHLINDFSQLKARKELH